mgnify:CR=1 FL=1
MLHVTGYKLHYNRLIISILLFILIFSGKIYIAYEIGDTKYKIENSELSLVERWSPVIYQDTDGIDYDADYITNFDFDGDWSGINNWENEPVYPLNAYVYYWVVETITHWFIGFAIFHPRDWDIINTDLNSHENDMEGVLLTIEKDGTQFGKLILMVTVAHLDFYSYVPSDSTVTNGHETIDGTIIFSTVDGIEHPNIYIEAKGHGIYGNRDWAENNFPGGDGVVYYSSTSAEEPEHGNDRNVGYALKNINELWDRRYYYPENGYNMFSQFGTFLGDTYGDNRANAPWGWNDINDGDVWQPQFFSDPAYLVDYYHDGLNNFSKEYIYRSYSWKGVILWENPYYGGKGELIDYDDPNLSNNLIGNDALSSIQISGSYTAILYRDVNFQDISEQFNNSDPDLSDNIIGSDVTSSLKIFRYPSPPRNLTAIVSNQTVILSWLPSIDSGTTPIINYQIYRNDTFFRLIGNTTIYIDTNVTPGTTYRYTVSARNYYGESAKSNEVSVTIPSPEPESEIYMLSVNVSLSDYSIRAGNRTIITVFVYNSTSGRGVSNATVKLILQNVNGTIECEIRNTKYEIRDTKYEIRNCESGTTDINGRFRATYIAGNVSVNTTGKIIAIVSAQGYQPASSSVNLTIYVEKNIPDMIKPEIYGFEIEIGFIVILGIICAVSVRRKNTIPAISRRV